MDLKKLVRKNIWDLKPYSSARSEFTGKATVFLDANENPYNTPHNRYPDPLQREVKAKISEIRDVDAKNIFLGVGSDECIDLAYRIFCEPGVDNVVAISPTYGMYEVCANINDVEYRQVPLNDSFDFDIENLLVSCDNKTKIIWICSPNNPTGNSFSQDDMRELCEKFAGIVMIDEAYIDFSENNSMISLLQELPNMIVMQTLSKAWGSAAIRLGIAYACQPIINLFNKVKYPYNINLLTQQQALEVLSNQKLVADWVAQILNDRDTMISELKGLKKVQRVYRTDANFVLVKIDNANAIYDFLRGRGVIVRNRNNVEKCVGCIRITVGTPDENRILIEAMKEYDQQ